MEKTVMIRNKRFALIVLTVMSTTPFSMGQVPDIAPEELSKYMNSIPPSKDFFCVGTGPTNLALHPDRAPHTQLAQQDGVILFSGTAPQQGLNFRLNVGGLVYRNQMSTLGGPEPTPQIGTAGLLAQRPWEFYPWSQARWHQGEDITWQGYRHAAHWVGGLPFWEFTNTAVAVKATKHVREDICGEIPGVKGYFDGPDLVEPVYQPEFGNPQSYNGPPLAAFNKKTSINLQLSRGIYQTGKIRPNFRGSTSTECPFSFREPWFQARAKNPSFAGPIDGFDLAKEYFPTYHNAYTYNELELDGGQLTLGFEPSATWPRQSTAIGSKNSQNAAGKDLGGWHIGGAKSGISMANLVSDEYANQVHFDRVPIYGWHNDRKVPPARSAHLQTDPHFSVVPKLYQPMPQSWRLPHKRLRTVQLQESGTSDPLWEIAYIYEHPDSDRISGTDHPIVVGDEWEEYKSLYSHLPQADWDFGRLPELNDETTLLTVQAYKKSDLEHHGSVINGAPFQDDLYVWGSDIGIPAQEDTYAVNSGIDIAGDMNGDGCPGICGVDDDHDGLVDEDCKGRIPGDSGFNGADCTDVNGQPFYLYADDDNENDDILNRQVNEHAFAGITLGESTDPFGDNSPADTSGNSCPGLCGVDDDGDGMIDEDSNGNQAYLDVATDTECYSCQWAICGEYFISDLPAECVVNINGVLALKQRYNAGTSNCPNPLYWRGTCADTGTPSSTSWTAPNLDFQNRMDPFAGWDDDEDGIIDEDGDENPLFVHMRSIDDDTCGTGKLPYLPIGATMPTKDAANLDKKIAVDCLAPLEAKNDPWTYQVQYVYARSNPYWLLSGRNSAAVPTATDCTRSGAIYRELPSYYYFPPFDPDINGDGLIAGDAFTNNVSGCTSEDSVTEQEIYDNRAQGGEFAGKVINFDGGDLPNVHPDCVPSQNFRGPQGNGMVNGEMKEVDAIKPSDIHLLKRIVRMRSDVENDPTNFTEQTWLYRYNDMGFLKAVFSPQDVDAIIAVDSAINEPDDILKYSDAEDIGGRPLISYASQWYTYYNPYVEPTFLQENGETAGIPICYEESPIITDCASSVTFFDDDDINIRLPLNGCDGQALWQDSYSEELHIDRDCSQFMRQNCGWCHARAACGDQNAACMGTAACDCADGIAVSDSTLRQLDIPGAQPRFRKYLIKTSRVRGADGEMHLYRFDYLGAANSVYDESGHITSYADAHNITIVDELVEQDVTELTASDSERNDFYIYEDDFQVDLDSGDSTMRPDVYSGNNLYTASSHYLRIPAYVKTRRVVVMNYYGIAISDRTILTPGFDGTQTSFVDNQQFELLNKRGQAVHVYDPSWVAQWRETGINGIKQTGRVLVELFGGHEGWYSVFKGIAKGSSDGALYNQQCKTPEIVSDVPVQRVSKDQLTPVQVTKHYARKVQGEPDQLDMPETEAFYYRPLSQPYSFGQTSGDIIDPAGTIGGDAAGGCNGDVADGVDLTNQESASVTTILDSQGADIDGDATDDENDGVTVVKYHYEFYGGADNEDYVKWKWRWEEPISAANGGTGLVKLEMWYFDGTGRLRLSGRGSGIDAGKKAPVPDTEFYITYYGFDELGRPNFQVEDFELSAIGVSDGVAEDILGNFSPLAVNGIFERINPLSAPQNFTIASKYNDIGMLVSRCVGIPHDLIFVDPSDVSEWKKVDRTDYAFIHNNTITNKGGGSQTILEWQDPNMYSIEYQHVITDNDDQNVWGTTTVTVLDKSGKFIEQRIIADGGNQKIDNFGWGISLSDYDYDGSIADWTNGATVTVPGDNWVNCDNVGVVCNTFINDASPDYFDPPYPPAVPNASEVWPPASIDQIVTLARSFKKYQQSSTLKPTHDIVYNDYSSIEPGKREVTREYSYDLEDRIARQLDPDGTVTRLLFDAKRRPTKIFKGSEDGCSDWFPREVAASGDDMLLMEQRLYNDGDNDCEHSPLPGGVGCTTTSINEDFPYDANMLVRVRNFKDSAETCTSAFDPETASTDMQMVYDWRGRPVISREIDVNDNKDTVVSVTTTIFDNLSRPTITATWSPDSGTNPTVVQLEAWQLAPPDTLISQILTHQSQLLSLSYTLYDERGRVFEQRSYDPAGMGQKYTFTRTHRDDFDRVIATVTPNGVTTNEYDSLGRVTQNSFWSKEDGANPGMGAGDLLTHTINTYDEIGNLTRRKFYDRKLNAQTNDITDTNIANSYIITYTDNWYDYAQRLKATANYGTNSADGYLSGLQPAYDASLPPVWNTNTKSYTIQTAVPEDEEPLINLYAYDKAGRRNFTQDPSGRVTQTWYDLLGRTILEAENIFTVPQIYEAPTRYTAHHYTRGGLLDAMAAVMPTDPSTIISPSDLNWDDSDVADDYAAHSLTVTDATVQMTQFVYGAEILNTTNNSPTSSIAKNLIAEVRYPKPDTGQPNDPALDDTDVVLFKYTMSGNVGSRVDQRGVTLNYKYGPYDDSVIDPLATYAPGDPLVSVSVVYPASDATSPVDEAISKLQFKYNTRGQLTNADTLASDGERSSSLEFTYDAFGNLLTEKLDPTPPTGAGDSALAQTTTYAWDWVDRGSINNPNPLVNRLASITYPSGRVLEYEYDNDISRMTGMKTGGASLVSNQFTGAGKTISKSWGNAVGYDLTSNSLDRFGRMTKMLISSFGMTPFTHTYNYDYDLNSNRTFAKIQQASHNNVRSYKYTYDPLNRLVSADRGSLDAGNGYIQSSGGTGQAWSMDVLGNWTGDGTNAGMSEYDISDTTPGIQGTEVITSIMTHETDETNQITSLLRNLTSSDPSGTITKPLAYDAAGNIISDGGGSQSILYTYDAFNRVASAGEKYLGGGDIGAVQRYDALGRRIAKTVSNSVNSTITPSTNYYYYDGHRILEHHVDGGVNHKQFIYGFNYIDEVVGYYDSNVATTPSYLLQDANSNVVGVVKHNGSAWYIDQEYSYEPYGVMFAAEFWNGSTMKPINLTTNPESVASPFTHQGLWYDAETNTLHNRGRTLNLDLGRFNQRDPNGVGLMASNAVGKNAQSPLASANHFIKAQYSNGMGIYEYIGSNSVNNNDPSGLETLLENAWNKAVSNWSGYLKTGGGKAWTRRLDEIQSSSGIFGNRGSGFDADVFDVINSLQNSKTASLETLEKASFQLRYGHIQSMLFAAGNFKWDDFIWERDEAILFDLIGGGFFAKACFVQGTQVLLDYGITKSIEDILIGTRVASWPDGLNVIVPETQIDPDSWRLIRLVAKDDEHGIIHINLLRSRIWVDSTGAAVDSPIDVSIEEMGIQGPATVTAIESCPDSAVGPIAGIVTGTFATERSVTINVFLDSLDEPIGITHQHPLYSIDREAWVGAGSLRTGERIRTAEGETTVDCIRPRADAESVFNLEIAGTHTYFVSPANVWAHNGCVPEAVKKSSRLFKGWAKSFGDPEGALRIAKESVNEVMDEAIQLGFTDLRYEIGGIRSGRWTDLWHINMRVPDGGAVLHLLSEAP